MLVTLDKKKCPHNHVCPLINVCPVGAISQGKDGYPIINYDLCIECGKCTRACPMKAIQFVRPK
ncbi:MAG: 4Fe-4S binding protein [Bacteroides sp.]